MDILLGLRLYKHTLVSLLSGMLISCGGGGSPATPTYGANACTVPDKIVFHNRDGVLTQRWFKSEDVIKTDTTVTANAAILECPGRGVQRFRFSLYSDNFFTGMHGDHVAVLTQATVSLGVPFYTARGVIIHRDWGVLGETYNRNGDISKSVLQCGVPHTCLPENVNLETLPHKLPRAELDNRHYDVDIISDARRVYYLVASHDRKTVINDNWSEDFNTMTLSGAKAAIVLLCQYDRCEPPFELTVYNIKLYWQ